MKLQLFDQSALNVSSDLTPVRMLKLTKLSNGATSAIQEAGPANPDNEFRYSSTEQAYRFNFKTTGLTTGTYALDLRAAGSAQTYRITLQVR